MIDSIRMRIGVLALLSALAVLGISGCEGSVTESEQRPSTEEFVLDNVRIVDTETGSVSALKSLRIEGDRIAGIGEPGQFVSFDVSVDGGGSYVVPGFNDMHEHALQSEHSEEELALMVANGITGFRQMVGSEKLLSRRRNGRLMPSASPELLSMPGRLLRGFMAADSLEDEISSQKEAGADFIKIIDLPRPLYLEALDIAERQGLPTTGHLPPSIPVLEANDAGMDAVEHLGTGESITLSCSVEEEAIRKEIAESPGPALPRKLPGFIVERYLANPGIARLRINEGKSLELTQRVNATFDEARCRALAQELANRHMWQIPTLIRLRTFSYADDIEYRTDPALKYVPVRDEAMWDELADSFASLASPEQRQIMEADFDAKLRLVQIFDEAGVPMLTGSDSGQWEVPGYSLHREFDLLASAGLSPLMVLQMTTLYPADFLGRREEMGTVEAGKLANLVLLRDNPVEQVGALHAIEGVVNHGRYYSRDQLDELLQRVESKFPR